MNDKDILQYFRDNLSSEVVSVEYVCDWKDGKAYGPVFDDYIAIGEPRFAIVKGDSIRMTEPEESYRLMAELPDE